METLTPQQIAGRLASHGKIADLTDGFSLENGHSFSILVITKANISGSLVPIDDNQLLLVDMELIQDRVSSVCPVPLNDWTPSSIKSLAANSIDLGVYDVYWASGFKAES